MIRITPKSPFGRRASLLLLSVLCLGSLGMATEPQPPIVIKMASLAPANSEWHDALLDMREQWLEASDGLVELRIFPSGQGGEESDVIGRMRMGRFQAGGFTLAGLQAITPAVVAKKQKGPHRQEGAFLFLFFFYRGRLASTYAIILSGVTMRPSDALRAIRSRLHVIRTWKKASGIPFSLENSVMDMSIRSIRLST